MKLISLNTFVNRVLINFDYLTTLKQHVNQSGDRKSASTGLTILKTFP